MRQTYTYGMDGCITYQEVSPFNTTKKRAKISQMNFNDTDDFLTYISFLIIIINVRRYGRALSTNFDATLAVAEFYNTPATLHFMRKMNHFICEKKKQQSERFQRDYRKTTAQHHQTPVNRQRNRYIVWQVRLVVCEPYEKYIHTQYVARQCRHLDKYKIHVNSDEYKFPFYFDCDADVVAVVVAVAVVTS